MKTMDYMIDKGFNLLVSYNFISKCIATNPELLSSNAKNNVRYKGKMIITSPPKDYDLWEEICYEYTRHIVDRIFVVSARSLPRILSKSRFT